MENCYNKCNLTPINEKLLKRKFDFKFTEIIQGLKKSIPLKDNSDIKFHLLVDPIMAILYPNYPI